MLPCDDVDGTQREETVARVPLRFSHRELAAIALAVALAGCGLADGPGSLFVDPGHYSVYHCNELTTQWKTLVAREKELRDLMNKASEGGGGAVIGTLAYRSDYESVLTQQRLVQRQAAEKKCELAPGYQSDQTIR